MSDYRDFSTLKHRVGNTTYTVGLDLLWNKFVVQARTAIVGREAERFSQTFDAEMFDGDVVNAATEALAEGLKCIQPKVEENERRRRAGEPSLGEEERQRRIEAEELHAEKLHAEKRFLAEMARLEGERQQEELEELPGYGMF